jgi:hypothetical protein
VRKAKILGRNAEEGFQQMLVILVQQRAASSAGLLFQGRRFERLRVQFDPVVDALPGHAQHTGDVSRRASAVELQDCQGSAEQSSVRRLNELAT